MTITLIDEELHTPGAVEHWQESYYFNWCNADSSEFGFTRIGLNHGERKADVVVVHLTDGVPVLVYGAKGVPFDGDPVSRSVSDGLTVRGLTYTMTDPLGSWRLTLAGEHTMDLAWKAYTPVIDFHDSLPDDVERTQEHFEQAGHVRGHVTVDGTRHEIDGFGERDKSWGVRDWNGLIGWDWIAGQFGEDLAFNATRTDVNGELMSTGFVWADGEVQTITDVKIEYTWVHEHQPEAAVIRVTVESGQLYTIRATAQGRLPLVKAGLFIEETQSRFTLEHGGQTRQGVGIVEHAYHVGTAGTLRRIGRLLPVLRMARKMTSK